MSFSNGFNMFDRHIRNSQLPSNVGFFVGNVRMFPLKDKVRHTSSRERYRLINYKKWYEEEWTENCFIASIFISPTTSRHTHMPKTERKQPQIIIMHIHEERHIRRPAHIRKGFNKSFKEWSQSGDFELLMLFIDKFYVVLWLYLWGSSLWLFVEH